MTTLTTTRPIGLLPSLILPESMTCNDRSSITSGRSPTPPPSLLSHSMMHPDNLLLHNHGVTSPRLSSTSSAGSCITNNQFKNCDSPLEFLNLNHHAKEISSSTTEKQDDIPVSSVSSLVINNKESYVNPFYLIVSNDHSEINNHETDNDITDRMSCCSDDSELSVGQECCDNNNIDSEQISNNNNNNNQNCIENMDDNRNDNNNQSNSSDICINSGKPSANDDSESMDNTSSLSDENQMVSSLIGDNVPSDDIVSNASSPQRDISNIDPILMATTGIRIPAPIIRPSPTRLQEEFIKKSHLYAEELMKQQMQFMAAARVSAFSLRHPGTTPEFNKISFRPHIKQQLEINDNLLNLNGIQSHLSVISKLSSQISNNESAISKLNAFGTSRKISQSPSSLNPFHGQHSMHHHHHHQQFMNNDFNETNLKFSIDNILKADFGRRITDPLLKRNSSSNNNNNNNNNNSSSGNSNSNCGSSVNSSNKGSPGSRRILNKSIERSVDNKNSTPIDLTNITSQQPNDTLNLNFSSNCSNPIATSTTIIDKHQSFTSSNKLLTGSNNLNIVTTSSQTSSSTSSSSSSSSSTSSISQLTIVSESNSGNNGSNSNNNSSSSNNGGGGPMVWPAWVYCTRYSDRPSSGPRTRKPKKSPGEKGSSSADEKRPRTAFSGPQLARLKHEFSENRYLTERRRQQLSAELGLNEAQIKIWFQNKRAKIKKASGTKNPLALQLMAQGLYNHSTVPLTREEEELQELQAKNAT